MSDGQRACVSRSSAGTAERPGRIWWLAQAGILAISVVMRCYRLCDLPFGMHYDEAYNGLDATYILSLPLYRWPVFFTGNFGREPLHIYMVAVAQALLGPGVAALRSVAAVCAVALGPALSWLAWELAPSLGLERKRLSLWAAAAPLTVLLTEILSRYATRNVPLALLETLLLAALWRAWRMRRRQWWLTAGALGGLCFYTYLPARLLPLLMTAMLAVAFVKQRDHLRQQARNMALGVLVAGMVVAPLALYLLQHPQYIFARTSQVSALSGNWLGTVAQNAVAALGMVFLTGDANIRNNIPGRPLFDPIMALSFIAGLAWLGRRIGRGSSLFVLAWLGTMLLPTVLSSDAPHFLRAIGAVPALVLIAAVGIEAGVVWVQRHWPRRAGLGVAGGWLALAASTAITWHSFSTVWAKDEALYYARDGGLLAVATALKDELVPGSDPVATYLSPSGWDHPTTLYGLVGADPPVTLTGFDGRVCVRVAQGAARYVILTNEDFRGRDLLHTYLPDAKEHAVAADSEGRTIAAVIEQPLGGDIAFPEMTAHEASLEDGISLAGYWLSTPELEPGGRLYVRLWWQARATPAGKYTAFTHLLTVADGGSWQQLAGADAEPGLGTCATDTWLPGETIVDEMEISVPESLDPGREYWLAVGLYTLADGKRLTVEQHADGQILIGPLIAASDG